MYDQPDPPQATDDAEFAEHLKMRIAEAQQRTEFHRRELDRWDRIGRAASVAMQELMPSSAPHAVASNTTY